MKQNSSLMLHSMEVGMHTASQCLRQAHGNMQAHCVEPSPASIPRIRKQIMDAPKENRRKVKLYQLAASDRSGMDLEFHSEGGTGDHIGGDIDFWKMTKREAPHGAPTRTVIVKSVAIDDIIDNKVEPTTDYTKEEGNNSTSMSKIDRLFLLKVDTQGHEPSVFSGLTKSIREHKIDIILTEYWPKGMDFMYDAMGPGRECKKSVAILQLLADSGYKLFSLSVFSHPKAPYDLARKKIRQLERSDVMPWNTLWEHCMWFYDLERKYRDTGGIMADGEVYQFGYWTDILAVRPGFKFLVPPNNKWTQNLAKLL